MIEIPVIKWFDRGTVKHLRFPFSFFLLPVYLFALSQALLVSWPDAVAAFVILHVLVFPSSNGYNSYQDRDDTSIGGLKYPPKVSDNLFYATLLLDAAALLLAYFTSPMFALLLAGFIAMSRMYSYRGIRLKKHPVTAFLVVFTFQGGYVFLMTLTAVSQQFFPALLTQGNIQCMLISSLFIGSMYPLTQIYQHEADRKDGVISLSYLLGYRGTFVFSALLFMIATCLLAFYLIERERLTELLFFGALTMPVVFYLMAWYGKVMTDNRNASFENTMKANIISSGCMNMFFMLILVNNRMTLI